MNLRSRPSRPCKLAAWIIVVALQTGIATAQYLVTNPGFETGDTTGWFAFGSPTIAVETNVVHSGAYAGLVSGRTQTYQGIAQSFLGVLQANLTYSVSAWLQLAGGSNQTMQITAQLDYGSVQTYTGITTGTVSAGSWTQLSGQFTLNPTGALAGLTIYFEMPSSATNAYYIDDVNVLPPGTGANGQCTVDGNAVFQRIDGFGASSAWQSVWNTNEANMFFSTNCSGVASSLDHATNFYYTGIGLSLLRSHIAPGGTTVETNIMVMAQARGARVWSAPWSPAANFKSTQNVNGGSINGTTANYEALASQVAGYVASMKNIWGVNLYAVSVQNEPDAQVTSYESCNWSAQQIHDYVPYLYNALAASNVAATKIMLPESENWQDYSNLAATAMSDSTSNDVAIIADHNYDGATGPSLLAKNTYGKALWETEVSLLTGSDSSITNAVYYAGRIHAFLTSAQVNAWHYWWLMAYGVSNQGLTDTNGVPAKRMYALGQFARFVRPNYYRINVTNNTGSTLVSAYKDPGSSNLAIVAINSYSTIVTQAFCLTNLSGVSSVTPWITTSSLSLTNQTAVAVVNSNFTYALPAMSIVTFVGKPAAQTPPVFVPVANQTINPGVTLVLTNTATNPNLPQQIPSYTLVAGPTNATLNVSSGVFTWRPLLNQANTTNTVSVQATDNGTPPLSATNTCLIIVNPVAKPVESMSQSAGGQISVVMSGMQGPDYTLLVSSNLTRWQTLFATSSPALPVTVPQTNNQPMQARFYRVQIGP